MRRRWWLVWGALVLVLWGCGGGARATAEPASGILFTSERDGNLEIYLVQPDGSGLARLTDEPGVDTDPAWSPDGRQIVFRSRRDGSSDIFIMDADALHPANLVRDPRDSLDDEFVPAWNPDGETLAVYTDRFFALTSGSCRGNWGAHHLARDFGPAWSPVP